MKTNYVKTGVEPSSNLSCTWSALHDTGTTR